MENKKNTLTIVLLIIIAILCISIGWLLGGRFADKENEIISDTEQKEESKDDSTNLDENKENVNIEIAFNNFVTSKNLNENQKGYDENSLNSINCLTARMASGNGYSLEIYKFDNEVSAKKYYNDQKNNKLSVSNVKQLINSGSKDNYDFYEAILTPNLEESPVAIGNEIEYIYQVRINNFYIILFETSTNPDKTNMINLTKELKTTLNLK